MRITNHPVPARTWCRLPGTPFEVQAFQDAEVRCADGIWYVGSIPGVFLIREVRPDGMAGPQHPAQAPFPFPDPAHEVHKLLAKYDRYLPLYISRPPAIPLSGRPAEPEAGS